MRFWLVLGAILLCILALFLLLRDLPPPARVSFAAGPRDGGYWLVAERYREILARDGIAVDILESAGSVENLALLTDGRAEVGLLQGGVPTDGSGLEALAAVFPEPVLILVRRDGAVPTNPGIWRDLAIASGGPGSGTQLAVEQWNDLLRLDRTNRMVDLGGADAAAALLAGDVDVAFFVAPLAAPYVRVLLESPEVRVLPLDHALGISVRLPHSNVATVPSGAISLDPVQPALPLDVIVLQARLVARPGLHPAVIDRLMLAAREIHGGHGIFTEEGEYPTLEGVDMPIDPGAAKLIQEGQSFYHSFLPYWVAAQIRQVLVVVVPLLFVLIPLIRSLPLAYTWSMRRRVWRHYQRIREIEDQLAHLKDPAKVMALDLELTQIDDALGSLRLPPAFRGRAYDARMHVELVRRRIARQIERLGEPATPG
ncbi:TAXI family TRAP transporter solute-binding subunit [Tropicimonas sp. IMCC34043]|uniref:TAXI family TRAP transporter solute-binding subunit n=1 Tax=Tropicimonas sp. IMCC34043 TaxID=2248760 RepID=UPI000E2802F0|nr:TAXI family TRAP transporter solute-binding subunit [Tropicimonas sp. IMCC34043]